MSLLASPVTPAGRGRFGLGKIWSQAGEVERLSSGGIYMHVGVQAWRNVLASPFTSLVTLMSVALSLVLLGAFLLLIENIQSFVLELGSDVSLSVFLKDDLTTDGLKELETEMRRFPNVSELTYRSKAEALKEFRKSLGAHSQMLEGLESGNPLPASLEVKFSTSEVGTFEQFAESFARKPGIEQIEFSQGFVRQFGSVLKFIRWLGVAAMLFVLVLTGCIMANTIRLAFYSHREEIEIMRLVGATPGLVRAPYMIEGFVEGLLGAILSLGILSVIFHLVRNVGPRVDTLAVFFPEMVFLSWFSVLVVLLCGTIVGLGGAYLATREMEG